MRLHAFGLEAGFLVACTRLDKTMLVGPPVRPSIRRRSGSTRHRVIGLVEILPIKNLGSFLNGDILSELNGVSELF